MISDKQKDDALLYLAATDEECARAKARMKGLEAQEKTVMAMVILENRIGTTVQEREALAKTDSTYLQWQASYESAVLDYEIINNKRNTAEITIECWRSENANRRQAGGNL